MSDRELLELAARAAGLEWQSYHLSRGLCLSAPKGGMVITQMWNPLEDDGDAFRLAVLLGFHVSPKAVEVWRDGKEVLNIFEDASDPCTATRRAIVRAAAEIQRQRESK